MEVKEITNREIWEGFLQKCQEKTFLDSWNWGEFQKKEGNKIWRLGIEEGGELVGVALVVKVQARRGTFLFVPHGPVTKIFNFQFSIFKQFIEKLKEIAKKEKASFIRIAPIWLRSEENIRIFKNLGFRKAPIHIHPEITWELDIRSSEEEILAGMRKTTRYLIRQAQKNPDIEIVKTQNIEDLKKFNEIYSETAKRHKFVPFSSDYLKNQFSSFLADNQILIFLGKYKGEIISLAVIVYWQGIGFYHHGASLLKYSSNKVPVSYSLQWEAIKEAKNRGCEKYNFWGIAPIFSQEKMGNSKFQIPNSKQIINPKQIQNRKHPWYGLTLFKMGFGGYPKQYIKTQDLPLSRKYWLTYVFEKIRKTKRGL